MSVLLDTFALAFQGYVGSDCSQCAAGFVDNGGGVCVKYSVADEAAPIAVTNAAAIVQLEAASSTSGAVVATAVDDGPSGDASASTTSSNNNSASSSVRRMQCLQVSVKLVVISRRNFFLLSK